MKTVTTPKGTALPLISLKGKDYLQVAHRIQWFTEMEQKFSITTEFLVLDDEQTVCKATIITFDDKGLIVKQAQGTKRETKKDFSDHTEKAETGALGRALIELGYGTQFALSDLDEGTRIVDSPVVDVKAYKAPELTSVPVTTEKKTTSFSKKQKTQVEIPANITVAGDGTANFPPVSLTKDGGWQ